MTRAVFQAGVQMEAYRSTVGRLPQRILRGSIRCGWLLYGELDLESVLATPGILRMRKKVHAMIANARALPPRPAREHGTLKNYLHYLNSYEALAKDFKRRFALMGDMNVWYFLFRTGEPVPRLEEWVKTIRGEHPRMREMVDLARSPRTLARTSVARNYPGYAATPTGLKL